MNCKLDFLALNVLSCHFISVSSSMNLALAMQNIWRLFIVWVASNSPAMQRSTRSTMWRVFSILPALIRAHSVPVWLLPVADAITLDLFLRRVSLLNNKSRDKHFQENHIWNKINCQNYNPFVIPLNWVDEVVTHDDDSLINGFCLKHQLSKLSTIINNSRKKSLLIAIIADLPYTPDNYHHRIYDS